MNYSLTWSQAFHYAFQAGYGVSLSIAAVFLALAVLYVLKRNAYAKFLGNGFLFNQPNVVTFVLLIPVLTLGLYKPVAIKTDNEKVVTVEQYNQLKADPEASNAFWDSVHNQANTLLHVPKK